MEVLLWTTVAAGGTAVTWWGSDLPEVASTRLAAHHELPPIVQGSA